MPLRHKLIRTCCILAFGLCALFAPQVQAQTTKLPPERQPQQKLAPHLLTEEGAQTSTYRVRVTDRQAFYTWLNTHQPQASVQTDKRHDLVLVAGLTPAQLKQLATCPAVRYIDKPNRLPAEELELRDTDFTVNNIYAAQASFPGITGQGMAVSVKERAFDPADIDLKGRVIQPQNIKESPSPHATTMATLIAGAGNSGPAGKGILRQARVAHASFAELLPDDSQTLLAQGISVQNHSYGVGVENYYGIEAQAYDQQSHQHTALLHVFSSGNSGDKAETSGPYAHLPGIGNLTGQFKVTKNGLVVGALDANGQVGMLSSRGPAYDGRIKPELVAYGAGGTSEAAATVSGIALQVQQVYKAQKGQLPPGDLVKAVLINSADELAAQPGPTFASGYGNADALGALRTMQEQRYFQGAVTQAQSQTYTLHVPTGTKRLKLTLVWHDPEAEAGIAQALMHDLDLRLHHAGSGQTWQPWVLSAYPHPDSLQLPARTGRDSLNNAEQIRVDIPPSGTYTIHVSGHSLPQGTQNFSLAYELDQDDAWLYPVAGATLVAGQANRITWQTAGNNMISTTILQYRLHGSDTWHTIATGIAGASHYTWQAPDTTARAQLRLLRQGIALLSQEFLLARPTPLQLGYNCDGQVLLQWPNQANVEAYQVYRLGATHLEPLLQTSDTLAVLHTADLQSTHLAVAPIIQGMAGAYSRSLAVADGEAACYVNSFQPRQFTTPDSALFSLSLSTTYGIKQLRLERLSNNEFETIYESDAVNLLFHELVDKHPVPGRNVYRAGVLTSDGKLIYSQEETVFYTPPQYTLLYPNPVQAGQPVYVALAGETVQTQLYDRMGRLVQASEAAGALKEIQTSGLPAGLYIIRLLSDTGATHTTRVVVQ